MHFSFIQISKADGDIASNYPLYAFVKTTQLQNRSPIFWLRIGPFGCRSHGLILPTWANDRYFHLKASFSSAILNTLKDPAE